MRLLCIIPLLALVACGSGEDDGKTLTITTSGECSTPFVDSYFDAHLEEVRKRLKNSDLNPDDLGRIVSMKFAPAKEIRSKQSEDILGSNLSVTCAGRTSFVIRIVDPSSLSDENEGDFPRGSPSLDHVIYHEIMHSWFKHYDNNPDLGSEEFGLMAAKTKNRPELQHAAVLERLDQCIFDANYRNHTELWRK